MLARRHSIVRGWRLFAGREGDGRKYHNLDRTVFAASRLLLSWNEEGEVKQYLEMETTISRFVATFVDMGHGPNTFAAIFLAKCPCQRANVTRDGCGIIARSGRGRKSEVGYSATFIGTWAGSPASFNRISRSVGSRGW